MLFCLLLVHYFLLLSSILLYGYTTNCLSTHWLIDIYVSQGSPGYTYTLLHICCKRLALITVGAGKSEICRVCCKTGYCSKNSCCWDFTGGPVVKNPCSNAGEMGLIPGRGTKIPHTTWCGRKKKRTDIAVLVQRKAKFSSTLGDLKLFP